MNEKTLYVCNGCCCGHPEKGNPEVQNELFNELVKESDISIKRPYCLGPCHLANVVKVEKDNKEYWFQKINTKQDVEAVVAFTKKGIEFLITHELKERVAELGYSPVFGARQMRRVIQDKVENPLASALLSKDIKRGDKVSLDPQTFTLKIN